MNRDVRVQLKYEMLIALLQGKTVEFLVPVESDSPNVETVRLTILSPFEGVFLTFAQIREIQLSSEERIFNMLQKIMQDKNI